MSVQQLYVKVNTVDYSAWLVQSYWGNNEDGIKDFLRENGVEAFTFKHPSFFGRLQGWMEVPQGSCVKVNLNFHGEVNLKIKNT